MCEIFIRTSFSMLILSRICSCHHATKLSLRACNQEFSGVTAIINPSMAIVIKISKFRYSYVSYFCGDNYDNSGNPQKLSSCKIESVNSQNHNTEKIAVTTIPSLAVSFDIRSKTTTTNTC